MCIMRMCVVVMLEFEGKLVINVVLCDYRLWKSIHYCFKSEGPCYCEGEEGTFSAGFGLS